MLLVSTTRIIPRRAGLTRERFANKRGAARTNRERARTNRERARLGANESRTGAARRERARHELRFEVHESAAFFTAGNLPLLKKRLKPLLGGSFLNTWEHRHHIADTKLRCGRLKTLQDVILTMPDALFVLREIRGNVLAQLDRQNQKRL